MYLSKMRSSLYDKLSSRKASRKPLEMISPAQLIEMEMRLANNRRPRHRTLPEQCEALPEVKAVTKKIERENELRDDCEKHFRSKGWLWFTSSPIRKTTRRRGEPDFTVCADQGITFWIELKKPGEKRTVEQCQIAAWLLKLGHRCILADSIEEVIRETTL